jgi:hypothetical protein
MEETIIITIIEDPYDYDPIRNLPTGEMPTWSVFIRVLRSAPTRDRLPQPNFRFLPGRLFVRV